MAGPFDLTGQNIETTYQRVLQTDGVNIYDGTGSLFNISGSGGGTIIYGGENITGSFTNQSTWVFNHNLGNRYPIVQILDSNFNQVIPQNIELTNDNTATITFPTSKSGYAIASLGGGEISASYASTSSYVSIIDGGTF